MGKVTGPRSSMATTLEAVRRQRPLVHCITNHVTSGLVANVLLALGAIPAMVEAVEEVGGFVIQADALAVNLGTLTPPRAEAMRRAACAAGRSGIPWVLDPVAAGALASRADLAKELLAHKPAVIRGNASEIPALLDGPSDVSGRGPDASALVAQSLPSARRLAALSGAAVAVTGSVDWVVGPRQAVTVHGGHPIMARVSGAGCAATAVIAACLAVQADRVLAAAQGLGIFGQAGAIAAGRSSGPGSFVPALLDALAALEPGMLDPATLRAGAAG